MVHSAFDRFSGFQSGPNAVIRVLLDAVGTTGTLVMPTIPFQGSAIDYARSDPVFDARHTMSRMGLITELFRRAPGVARSLHPTHSVAAWGCRAETLIAGHEQADTPCGRHTPYGRLLEHDGKILLAGVPANTMTFGYFVVVGSAPLLPFPAFSGALDPLPLKDHDGVFLV